MMRMRWMLSLVSVAVAAALSGGCAVDAASEDDQVLAAEGRAMPGYRQILNFERGTPGAWRIEGNAGIDYDRGFARSGKNNGWVNGSSGWHSIRFGVNAVGSCSVGVWVLGSANLHAGYVSVVEPATGRVLFEHHIAPNGRYQHYRLHVGEVETLSYVDILIGLWGTGDSWLRVDDAEVYCGGIGDA